MGRPPRGHRPDAWTPAAGAARNLGVATAVAAGAEHLVLLDVDCVPSGGLVARYGELLGSLDPAAGPTLLCGDVAYERDPDEGPQPPRHHPARPELGAQEVRVVDDVTLFWSLSFAVTAADLAALGGFDEGYVGYGAEDTDVGQRLARAGAGCSSSAAPGPSTSGTRARARRSSTSRTSCSTPTGSRRCGAGGR